MTDTRPVMSHANGAPVVDNLNIETAGPRGPALLQDIWLIEKLAHFDREVIPERRMHAKGWGAYGTFTVTRDITRYTKAKLFAEIGKKTDLFACFSTVAGERGAADAERDIRGFALKFYTEEGNWDIVGNNTPVFFFRDPLRFPDLNHAIKRDPRTGLRSDISVTSYARAHSMTCAGNGGLLGVDDEDWYDKSLVRRRWGRRSETYMFGSRKGKDDRFGPLSDGTPYDLMFVFDDMGYNFEPSEIMAAYGLVQMTRLEEFNGRRQRAAASHSDAVFAAGSDADGDRRRDGVDLGVLGRRHRDRAAAGRQQRHVLNVGRHGIGDGVAREGHADSDSRRVLRREAAGDRAGEHRGVDRRHIRGVNGDAA